MLSPLTRSRLIALLLAVAVAAPILYAVFVHHGKFVRIWGGATLATVWAVQFARDRLALRREPAGDPARGLTVFVEPISFLCIKWGLRQFALAASLAGVQGRVERFVWSTGWRAFFAIPDLMSQGRNLRHAQRLADRLAAFRGEQPSAPIRLVTYSGGGYIALEALRRLPPGVRVERVTLLVSSVSSGYDLGPSLAVCDRIVNVCSPLDCFINGFGIWVLGTSDRRHRLAAGMIGFRAPPGSADRLVQVRWRPEFVRHFWFGGHMTLSSVPMVAELLKL